MGVAAIAVLGISVDTLTDVCDTGVGDDTSTRVEAGSVTGSVVAVGSLLVAGVVDAGVTEFNESGVESDSEQPNNPANMSRDVAKVAVRRRKSIGMGKLFKLRICYTKSYDSPLG